MPADQMKKIAWSTIVVIVSLISTFAGGVWAASRYDSQIRASVAHIQDHETRLRAVEKQVDAVAADVRWIRVYLEKAAMSKGAANATN